MRKLSLLVLALLSGCSQQSQSLPTVTYASVQVADAGARPQLDAGSDGFGMNGVLKWTPTACSCYSDGGSNWTLATGTVSAEVWSYVASQGQWSRNPGLDVTATAPGTSNCVNWGDYQTLVNGKRLKLVVTAWPASSYVCLGVDYVQE